MKVEVVENFTGLRPIMCQELVELLLNNELILGYECYSEEEIISIETDKECLIEISNYGSGKGKIGRSLSLKKRRGSEIYCKDLFDFINEQTPSKTGILKFPKLWRD